MKFYTRSGKVCRTGRRGSSRVLLQGRMGPNGETMDKKRLDQFRKQLEERRRDLHKLVANTAEAGRNADSEESQDVADRAASSYNKEFFFSQNNNERQLLNMVEAALGRIEEGAFGECIHCGEEINAKRLEAVPWTRYCINCQEKLERGLLEPVHE